MGDLLCNVKGEAHINAMMAWKEFEQGEKANVSLMSTLTKEHSKQIQENCTYIKTVAEVFNCYPNYFTKGSQGNKRWRQQGKLLGYIGCN